MALFGAVKFFFKPVKSQAIGIRWESYNQYQIQKMKKGGTRTRTFELRN